MHQTLLHYKITGIQLQLHLCTSPVHQVVLKHSRSWKNLPVNHVHMFFRNKAEEEVTQSQNQATYHRKAVAFHSGLLQQTTAAVSLTADRLHHRRCVSSVLAIDLHEAQCVCDDVVNAQETAADFSPCIVGLWSQQRQVRPKPHRDIYLQQVHATAHWNR